MTGHCHHRHREHQLTFPVFVYALYLSGSSTTGSIAEQQLETVQGIVCRRRTMPCVVYGLDNLTTFTGISERSDMPLFIGTPATGRKDNQIQQNTGDCSVLCCSAELNYTV